MDASIFAVIYVVCAAASLYIRVAFMLGISGRGATESSRLDKFLVVMIVTGQVFPLVYILTPFLDSADYSLPDAVSWLGALLMAASLVLLWRSHADLGTNFALTPAINGRQSLVRHGIYQRIRHPMYASIWLYALSMPLLIHNLVAGFVLLVIFAAFYFQRVPHEERTMLERFGEEYEEYVLETGRCLPRLK